MIHGTAPPLWISQLLSGPAVDSGLVFPLQPLCIPVITNKPRKTKERKKKKMLRNYNVQYYYYNSFWDIIIMVHANSSLSLAKKIQRKECKQTEASREAAVLVLASACWFAFVPHRCLSQQRLLTV